MRKDYYPYEEHSGLLGEMKLLPCPFCGELPYIESCDRIIDIGCDACGFHIYSHGLVQNDIETNVVTTKDKITGDSIEWYDKDAYKKAVAKWNRRMPEPPKEVSE